MVLLCGGGREVPRRREFPIVSMLEGQFAVVTVSPKIRAHTAPDSTQIWVKAAGEPEAVPASRRRLLGLAIFPLGLGVAEVGGHQR